MTGFNSKREAAADKLQEPSITRPCRRCLGTGDQDTGIPESPIATCKPCNGTGQIALAQPAQEPDAYQSGFYDGKKSARARCIKLVLSGTGEPVQTRTLEILQEERKRIAKLIEEDGNP